MPGQGKAGKQKGSCGYVLPPNLMPSAGQTADQSLPILVTDEQAHKLLNIPAFSF